MRKRPIYEVVGQLGLWGFIICGSQAAGLEHNGIRDAPWTSANGERTMRPQRLLIHFLVVGILMAFTAAMFILYTVAPILYRYASAVYYNLSLLSSNFYGLLFGLFLFVSCAFLH